jgi:two-component system chemotaxis response regulator CheB
MVPPPLRVLVVDDSAVVRQGLLQLLTRAGGFSVEVASDPLIAQAKLERARPDVIVLDLEMPRMDGLTFLRKLMRESPLPVVVCSGLVGAGSEAALQALDEGAVEVIAKPRLGVGDFLRESAVQLVDAVRGAALARWARSPARARQPLAAPRPSGVPRPPGALLTVTTDQVVAVGASTGGTDALRRILEAMPPDCPGLAIVQHMPEVFTSAFARHLQQRCRIEVKEAVDGDSLREGRALIAPGNRHLRVVRSGGHYRVEVVSGPLVCRHRPSVDVLFHSTARAAGRNAVGVILTGMGDDGADGLLAMKRAGAATLAQDEASCVVFGMPREAIARGAVDEVLPLEHIPAALLRRARAPR